LQFIGNLITFALLSDGQVCGGWSSYFDYTLIAFLH